MNEGYVIKGSNGTYFECWTAIGPCFGAVTKEDAMAFATEREAYDMMARHSSAFVGATVEQQ